MATGKKAMDKGQVYSDKLGGKVNDIAEKKFHTEAFWPVTGDFPKEMEKAARILRSFTGEQACFPPLSGPEPHW